MARIRYAGGETVPKGSYWNFSTGERVRISSEGIIPGKSSQSYYKAPPMVIISVGVVAAYMLLYEFPKYLVQFYEPYAETLVRAYVILDYAVIGSIFACMVVIGLQDILGGALRTATFNWRPARAYFAGRRQKDIEKKTPENGSGSEAKKE
ncbi:MAG: hypothetical protein C0402_01550 [Thermodesulfovibrio sp.]|nr:hypothetical protein [Thermodesulfovibrio sp.]